MADLRQLRAFVAVAEERNFTRAAERLHLAQQAVSKTVAGLEAELGVELLERTSREVRLTAAGAALLEPGRAALVAAEAAFAQAREVGRGIAGTVRLGVSPAVGPGALRDVVGVLRDGTPGLGVSVVQVRPRGIAPALRDRELDLVVARTVGDEPEISRAPLRPTPAVLAVPAGHRLAAQDGPVSLADADGERLLVASSPGTPYTNLLLAHVAAAGARVEVVESNVVGIADLDVVERDAVSLVPAGWPEAPGVALVELRDDVALPLLVAWAAGVESAAVRRLRARLAPPRQ